MKGERCIHSAACETGSLYTAYGCDSAASQHHNVYVQSHKHTHISLLVKRGIQSCIGMLLVLALCLLCACCSIMLVLNGCEMSAWTCNLGSSTRAQNAPSCDTGGLKLV
jgi:hypothetical protein